MSAILQEMLKISIFDISLKITYLRLQPHLPGATDLIFLLITLHYMETDSGLIQLYVQNKDMFSAPPLTGMD